MQYHQILSRYLLINDPSFHEEKNYDKEKITLNELFVLLFKQYPQSVYSVLALVGSQYPVLNDLLSYIQQEIKTHIQKDKCSFCKESYEMIFKNA